MSPEKSAYSRFYSPATIARTPLCRADRTWQDRTRRTRATEALDLPGPKLLAALAGVLAHRRREWSERDSDVVDAVEARAWSFESIQTRRTLGGVPLWIHAGIAPARFWPVLGLLVDAYRAGALGVLVSYEEMGALFGKSRATWKRWRRELIALGLIRQIGTCSNASDAGRARDNGRNLYQAGIELLAIAGVGVNENTGGSEAEEAFRRRCAGQARAKARAFRRVEQFEAWKQQRPGQAPADNATQEPPALEGEARAVAQGLELEGAKLPNPNTPEISQGHSDPTSHSPSPSGMGGKGLGASLPQAQAPAQRPGLRPKFSAEPPPNDELSGWTLREYTAQLLNPGAPGKAIPVPRADPPEGPPEPVDPYAAAWRLRAERIAAELAPQPGDPLAPNKAKLWAVLGIGPAGPDTEDPNQGG